MDICFLDMDGVLADFSKQVEKMLGYDSEIVKDRERSSLSEVELKIKQEISKLVHGSNDFWKTMPKTEYADELLNFCKNNFDKIFILSNYNPPDTSPHRFFAVKSLKTYWLEQELDMQSVGIIISKKSKSSFVPSQEYKGILVDDINTNIVDWNNHGGIGILHKDYSITKNKLDYFIKLSKNDKILALINALHRNKIR